MSIVRSLLAVGVFTLVAACTQQEEPVMVEDPIMEEAGTTKY